MTRYRKRPVVIDAIEWKGHWADLLGFITVLNMEGRTVDPAKHFSASRSNDSVLQIHTLEGKMDCRPGDWLVCGVEGEFYPVKPAIFEQTYEPVDASAESERG